MCECELGLRIGKVQFWSGYPKTLKRVFGRTDVLNFAFDSGALPSIKFFKAVRRRRSCSIRGSRTRRVGVGVVGVVGVALVVVVVVLVSGKR